MVSGGRSLGSFGSKMKPDNLIAEARARILWGESSSSVRSFLISNGVSEIDADAQIKEVNAERNWEIRKIGIKKTFIGAVLTVVAGIFFYSSLKDVDLEKMNYGGARGFVMIALVIALGGLYGIWKLIDGIAYLVRPRSEEKSVFEISE